MYLYVLQIIAPIFFFVILWALVFYNISNKESSEDFWIPLALLSTVCLLMMLIAGVISLLAKIDDPVKGFLWPPYVWWTCIGVIGLSALPFIWYYKNVVFRQFLDFAKILGE